MATERPEGPTDPSDLWHETLWSVGLIGAVILVVVLVAQLGRI
jgi:hypothetical protein